MCLNVVLENLFQVFSKEYRITSWWDLLAMVNTDKIDFK